MLGQIKYRFEKDLSELVQGEADSNYLNSIQLSIAPNLLEDKFKLLRKYGKRVLFCSGQRSAKKNSLYQECVELFAQHKIELVDISGIQSNPPMAQILRVSKLAKEKQIDFIFSLGGGSVIDFAKAVSVAFFGDLQKYMANPEEIQRAIPHIACATNSGSGSLLTPYAVIYNESAKEKRTLKHRQLLPAQSWIDTRAFASLTAEVVAPTGFDILAHAIEVYTRRDCDTLCAKFSMRAIRLVNEFLVPAIQKDCLDSKIALAYAECYAAMALARKGTHLAHAISHPISSHLPNINHGQALAILFPSVIFHQMNTGEEQIRLRYAEIGAIFGDKDNPSQAISVFISKIGLGGFPKKIKSDALDRIYKDTMRYRLQSVKRCPAKLGPSRVKQIIYESFGLKPRAIEACSESR